MLILSDANFWYDFNQLLIGAGLALLGSIIGSLFTIFLQWLLSLGKFDINIKVLEKDENSLRVKVQFINRSKNTRHVTNVSIRYYNDEGYYDLIQNDNLLIDKGCYKLDYPNINNGRFSFSVPGESIVEEELLFSSKYQLNEKNKYYMYFNSNKNLFKFKLNSQSVQKLTKLSKKEERILNEEYR